MAFKGFFEQGTILYSKRQWLKLKLPSNKKVVKKIIHDKYSTLVLLDLNNGLVDRVIYYYGFFEKNLFEHIKKELYPHKTFVDIGANIGFLSLVLSRYAKQVYSFEPIPSLFEQFEKSIQLNGFSNIRLYNIACGDVTEQTHIRICKENMGGSSILNFNQDQDELVPIQVDLLDNQLSDIQIDVIKIDVEGYEYQVLKGAERTLKKCTPTLFLEYSPNLYPDGVALKLYKFLKNVGYNNFFHIEEGKYLENFEDFPLEQCNLLIKKSLS